MNMSKLVEFHAGRIRVESKLAKGSAFYFRLPRTEPQGIL